MEDYNLKYDRCTTKNTIPLIIDYSIPFSEIENKTTSDDIVIRELAQNEQDKNATHVYATKQILSVIMTATKSVYSWDIIIQKIDNLIFLDKRENSSIDLLTVNETSREQPLMDDSINGAISLSHEATLINHFFSKQVLQKKKRFEFKEPLKEDTFPTGLKYKKWNISDDLTLTARCEIDGIIKSNNTFLTIKGNIIINYFNSHIN